MFFVFKQKTAYEMRISDWSSDVCSSDLNTHALGVAMYTDYVFAVQVGGVILLVGMIAAIALTLRKRHDVKRNRPSEQIKVQAKDRLRLVSIPSQTEAPAAAPRAEPAKGDSK